MRRFALVPLLLVLAACDPVSGTVIAQSGLTTLGTVDRLASKRLDQECSLLNVLDGDGYCRSRTIPRDTMVHCYRSLGRVDCYATPVEPERATVADAKPAADGKPRTP